MQKYVSEILVLRFLVIIKTIYYVTLLCKCMDFIKVTSNEEIAKRG